MPAAAHRPCVLTPHTTLLYSPTPTHDALCACGLCSLCLRRIHRADIRVRASPLDRPISQTRPPGSSSGCTLMCHWSGRTWRRFTSPRTRCQPLRRCTSITPCSCGRMGRGFWSTSGPPSMATRSTLAASPAVLESVTEPPESAPSINSSTRQICMFACSTHICGWPAGTRRAPARMPLCRRQGDLCMSCHCRSTALYVTRYLFAARRKHRFRCFGRKTLLEYYIA